MIELIFVRCCVERIHGSANMGSKPLIFQRSELALEIGG